MNHRDCDLRMKPDKITLTRQEADTCIRLLSGYQTQLEDCISSALLPGATMPKDADLAYRIGIDRRISRKADKLIKVLSEQRRGK